MKKAIIVCFALCFLMGAAQTEAQISRKPQIEVFGGLAIPLSPDSFKDYYKIGTSIHGQYVIFPSPKFGISFGLAYEPFTFDGDALIGDLERQTGLDLTGVEVEGSAELLEIGIGIRPYLSPQESSTQLFLLGMATYNVLTTNATAKISDPYYGNYEETSEDEGSDVGLALGAGFEMPAGQSYNIIIQGLVRFILTSEEESVEEAGFESEGGTTSFVGVTAGLVF